MRMQEVKTETDKRAFLQVAMDIYGKDPNWIRPLDKDIEEVFDEKKNKFFKRGECKRWLFLDESGRKVGRVAAFVNRQYKQEQPTGGLGFFECDENYEHAAFILDHCREWLKEKGMEAMDGPINFGERDKWWGLLTDGFYPPLYGMNYNPPYYQTFFEQYGFQTYFNQVCFALKVQNKLSDKFYERHAVYAGNKDFAARRIDKGQMEKYAKDFTYIYNKAWAGHGGGKELDERTVSKMFKTMKPVMDVNIIWFVYHKEEPIAMWVNIPDLNQYFKHLNGQFGLLDKLKFLLLKKYGKCNRFVGIIFGVIPEFQGKGIDAFMIVEGAKVIQPMGKYDDYEMQWIGDFNPKMINIAESLGTHRSRTLRTYRFLFDREKEFKRHKML
jgi:hypothetical protein